MSGNKFFVFGRQKQASAPEPARSTESLAAEVQRKDARFRNSQYVFYMILIFSLFGILLAQYITLQNFADQSRQRREALTKYEATIESEVQQNKQNTLCLAKLFSLPNRANSTITNLTDCVIVDHTTGQTTKGVSAAAAQSYLLQTGQDGVVIAQPPTTVP